MTRNDLLKEAFSQAVAAFLVDVPVIMHGSGDVTSSAVHPDTAHLLSSLTTQYISNLVDAALDSHLMLQDGGEHSRVLRPPPPTFRRSRLPPIPLAPELIKANKRKRRRVRSADEFWDDPLPKPKIRKPGPTLTMPNRGEATPDGNVSIDEWVGVAGVDLMENRARLAYVRGTAALSTQSFIFPICHDIYAYGRVTEVQAAKRTIQPLLIDQTLMELVRTDGQTQGHTQRKKTQRFDNESDSDEDGEDEGKQDAEDIGPEWPGLEAVLPVHCGEGILDFAGSIS
jgi:hypothetical protein